MSKKPVVSLALSALFSTSLAACSGGGMNPPTNTSAANGGIMPLARSATMGAGSSAIQTSGTIAGMYSNGFTLQTGYPHGKVTVITSSSTSFTGTKPFIGESVSVSGSGSFSTSIAAATVTQAGSQAGSLQANGSITSLNAGGFVLQTGNPHGNVPIKTSSSTTFTGSKPFVGENVSVSGSGSFATAIDAITVTQAGATSSPTPSPAPSAVPTTLPTQVPSGTGSGVPGVIKEFQVFDFNTTAAQSTAAAKNESAVWGAGSGDMGAAPTTWLAGNSSVSAMQYVVQPTDHNAVSHHNLAWFQSNHPDWIVYDCDANNQPTKTVAYQPGLPNDVPLDIHNPDAVKYQIQTAGNFAIAHGANAIGADQTLFFDYDGGQQPGWFGCGVYQNGTFVRRWGASRGGFPNYDPQWNRDVAAWAATAKQVLTTDSTLAPHHLKLFVNHPGGNISDVNEQTLIANVDGILDETGFIDYGHYPSAPSLFTTALAYMQYVQHQGKMILENAKFSGNLNGDSSDFGLSQSQVAYAMSTYLIGNEGNASLFITPGPYGALYNFSEMSTINSQLGATCGTYASVGSAYVRKFTHGMVVVNPSTTTVSVPLNGVYTDVMGRTVTGTTLTVNPANGYILLGTGGC